jgi:hypothetical protein
VTPWSALWAVAASAAEPFEVQAEARALETLPTDFAVDPEGGTVGWGPALDTRLRLGARFAGPDETWRAELQGDVLSGQLAGATWALPSIDERGREANSAVSVSGLVPRKATLGGRLPWFDLEAGLTTASWGLGMVANDGATDPLFGRTDFGDRSLRVRMATAPFRQAGAPDGRLPLYLLVVGDRVVADDLARWSEGDRAYQGIVAALWVRDLAATDTRPGTRRAGVYGVVRDQVTGAGDHLRAQVLDAFTDWTWRPGRWYARLGAEGATTWGTTDAARSYLSPEGVRVGQSGLTVRTELGQDGWTLHLRGNYASGDATTDDDQVHDFRFDRDLDVGMVLFDEYVSALNLGAWRQATDPARAGLPPDGVDLLVDEGAFHAAAAVQPALVVQPATWLELRVGTVLAWSTSPVGFAYASFVNGGVPSNQLGVASAGRFLGSEFDWAIATRDQAFPSWRVRPSLELQVGHAWPGPSLQGGEGRIDHVLLAGRARY